VKWQNTKRRPEKKKRGGAPGERGTKTMGGGDFKQMGGDRKKKWGTRQWCSTGGKGPRNNDALDKTGPQRKDSQRRGKVFLLNHKGDQVGGNAKKKRGAASFFGWGANQVEVGKKKMGWYCALGEPGENRGGECGS